MMTAAQLAIDRRSPLPLYAQIHAQLQRLIVEGRADGVEFTDSGLARHFGVSRMTVRQALEALALEGLIKRERGKGTVVVTRPIHGQLTSIERFFDEWKLQGADVTVQLLERCVRDADSRSASMLGVPPGTSIGFFRRLRTVDGTPVCVEEGYIPCALLDRLSDHALETKSTWLVLREELRVPIARADVRILATAANAEEALLLNIAEGVPLLERVLICYGADDKPILAGPSRFRSDRFVYEVSVVP